MVIGRHKAGENNSLRAELARRTGSPRCCCFVETIPACLEDHRASPGLGRRGGEGDRIPLAVKGGCRRLSESLPLSTLSSPVSLTP